MPIAFPAILKYMHICIIYQPLNNIRRQIPVHNKMEKVISPYKATKSTSFMENQICFTNINVLRCSNLSPALNIFAVVTRVAQASGVM